MLIDLHQAIASSLCPSHWIIRPALHVWGLAQRHGCSFHPRQPFHMACGMFFEFQKKKPKVWDTRRERYSNGCQSCNARTPQFAISWRKEDRSTTSIIHVRASVAKGEVSIGPCRPPADPTRRSRSIIQDEVSCACQPPILV